MKAPEFWHTDNWIARCMSPLSSLFTLGSKVRSASTTPKKPAKPLICVGNLIAGGTGKTPVCLAIAGLATQMGKTPHFVAKGYGGKITAPTQVDLKAHTANDVGDEPLLLADYAPTWIAKDRAAGVAAASKGADLVIMDDGLQNPGITKTVSIVVVDGAYGFGNGRVMPAGPLRETIEQGLQKADALILLGADEYNVETLVSLRYSFPVIKGTFKLAPMERSLLKRPIAAFAGIGRPEKFFASLAEAGANVVAKMPFPDHHQYTDDDLAKLRRLSKLQECTLVTTTKDYVRLPDSFKERVTPLPASITWESAEPLKKLIHAALTA